jgi:ABC-type sugar transport system ATPase subunit
VASEPVLVMKDITKTFPGVVAVKSVTFTVGEGEVVGLVGENGAGKSTLMNILGGITAADSGELFVNGRELKIRSPSEAQNLGIGYIHQELELFPSMSVVENIFMTDFASSGLLRAVKHRPLMAKSKQLLDDLGLNVDMNEEVATLSYAERTIVEIAKAISKDAKILIFDEPTSSLTEREKENLFRIIDNLKDRGKAIIFISHNLEEVLKLSDRIVVLRDGQKVNELQREGFDQDVIVRSMIGHEVPNLYPKTESAIGDVVFEAVDLSREGKFQHVSFDVRQGEIFGIAGLLGSGKTEVVRAIFGIEQLDHGKILVDRKELEIRNPMGAKEGGLSYVTHDRHGEGLVLLMNVRENISLTVLEKLSQGPFHTLDEALELEVSRKGISMLSIKTSGTEQSVNNLSGGNQQKVVLAKWMATNARVFMLDEPTRGIDVGAKAEVHRIMGELVKNGAAVILVSSEIDELIGLADRVAVMFNGQIVAVLNRGELSRQAVMKYASVGAS